MLTTILCEMLVNWATACVATWLGWELHKIKERK